MARELELNVAILPEASVRDAAIDVSRRLRESYGTKFVLDGRTRHPHITVYSARFPEKSAAAISAYMKSVAARMAPFEVALGKFSRWNKNIFWDADASNEYMHLQKAVMYQLNPLRENLVMEYLRSGRWNMSETYSIQNYGSLLPGKDYAPHITVASMDSEQDAQKALQELRPRIAKFVAAKVVLGPFGENGALTEILEEFPFGGGSPYMLNQRNYF